MKDKVKHVVCGLGVGAHFEHWGYDPGQVIEKDWDEKVEAGNSLTISTASSHHESGEVLISRKIQSAANPKETLVSF